MDYTSLLAVLLGGIGSLVLWLILGPIMTGYGFKKLVKKAIDGDPDAMEVFMNVGSLLMTWATQTKYKTGDKIKIDTDDLDADGRPIPKEIPEELTPIQMLSKSVGTYAFTKFKSSAAGVKSRLGQQIQQEIAEGGGGLSPGAIAALGRGKIGPALIEFAAPIVADKLKKKNISSGSDTGQQGGWWNR